MQKYLYTTIFLLIFINSYSQITFGVHRSGDVIDLKNKTTVDWQAVRAYSRGLWLSYRLRRIELGTSVAFGSFDLRRPGYTYNINHTTIGFTISDSWTFWRKFKSEIRLYPYFRYFEDDLYTASMIVDGTNFGVGSNLGMYYNLYKGLEVGLGVKQEFDLLRSAIHSDEINQKNRFIKFGITSFALELKYYFSLMTSKSKLEN
jgi:hypothetical protein